MKPCPGHSPDQTIAAHYEDAVGWRRALHRHPQPSWLEFYATALVAEKLSGLGYRVLLGREVIAPERQLLLPGPEKLQAEVDRVLQDGAKEEFVAPARGGFTGVVGLLEGPSPGPTVAFRFDIDSNEVVESGEPSHRPAREGFGSQYPGYGHMCGHDAHTATGLLLAQYFAENRDRLRGKVKFLFQPNEENLCGAQAMADRGHLEDVDYLFGGHVGLNLRETGQIALNVHSFLAMSRFEVTYRGRAAHAGLRPDEGKNALLGACAAVSNLYAIARHGLGASRVNVGVFEAGTTWNVIPDRAYFRMETRGVTNEINAYMVQRAREVLEGAARMYDLGLEIKPAATGLSATNSPELVALGTKVAGALPSVKEIVPESAFNASEDVTVMMERVQKRGGKALFVMLGTPVYGGHHSSTFDLDERVIQNGAEFFAAMYDAVLAER
jgi:aminobenzoyl-glutamate utilization protein A